MNSREMERFLIKRGCTLETHRGGSSHKTVKRGNRTSQLPMHGHGRDLGKRLEAKILKDLGIEK